MNALLPFSCHRARLLTGLVGFVLLLPTGVLAQDAAAADNQGTQASRQWPYPRGDAQSSGATAETIPSPLAVIWEFQADDAIETTPVVSGGRVYVGDVMGKLYGINEQDGKPVWQKDYDTGFLASPAIKDDLLVIGDVEGNLYGLNPADGSELWKRNTEGEINGSAAFYQDKVLVTSQDGKLYCFNAKDGAPVWTYQTDDQIRCNPTIAGDYTFLGGCDGQLHVVDLKTGQALKEPLPLGGPTGSTPAVAGDRAYLPIMDGAVLAFDWKQHKEAWRYEDAERAQEYRGSAAVADDMVIVSSQYKQVDAISASTGDHLWRHTLRRRADASPLIAGSDVWIAATDGRLIRLSRQTGKEIWQYEIRGAFLAAPAIANGRLYLADDNGVVRCFAPGKSEK
jgi:outer membrane protein assembly factor BamB